MYDIIIKNGIAAVDGKGLVRADVCIRDKKIAYIGCADGAAAQTIDAGGMIVSPGFIDIHMHEEDFSQDRDYVIAVQMLRMGVTTCLAGNCGDQNQPTTVFRKKVEAGSPVNYMTLAGYNRARRTVAGLGRYDTATSAQMRDIAEHIAREIEDGASGISFGVEYAPGISFEEAVAAVTMQKERNIFVSMHYRADCDGCIDSIKEMIAMARAMGTRFQISHLSSCSARGQMAESLRLINAANAENPLLDYDTYPYDAACTSIGSACFDKKTFDVRAAKGARIMAGSGPLSGKYFDRATFEAVRRDAPDTLAVIFEMKEEEIAAAVTNSPCGMVASDGILSGGFGHPRAAGTFPRVLAKYVREEGLISLDAALERMTLRPAKRLGLDMKGKLAPGLDADVTVFDPKKIADRATYARPNLPPVGMKAVIVNGKLAVLDDALVCPTAGVFIQSV